MAEGHELIIDQDTLLDHVDAGCPCGWESTGHEDRAAAEDAWESHSDDVGLVVTDDR